MGKVSRSNVEFQNKKACVDTPEYILQDINIRCASRDWDQRSSKIQNSFLKYYPERDRKPCELSKYNKCIYMRGMDMIVHFYSTSKVISAQLHLG